MEVLPFVVAAIQEFPKVLTQEKISAACGNLGLSETGFCDRFAETVAESYLGGSLSWSDGDVAMNALSGYFFVDLPEGIQFPDYAFGVFLAFDAGETLSAPDNEQVTREQLLSLAKPKRQIQGVSREATERA